MDFLKRPICQNQLVGGLRYKIHTHDIPYNIVTYEYLAATHLRDKLPVKTQLVCPGNAEAGLGGAL